MRIRVLNGNAWTLDSLKLGERFDVVFSGLNFHHATPEELVFLAGELKPLCAADAIILSHDLYRPEATSYVRRPAIHPDGPIESLELIPGLKSNFTQKSDHENTGNENNWRDEFLQRYKNHLADLEISKEKASAILKHVSERDYPLSGDEVAHIFSEVGFTASFKDFRALPHPLGCYLGILWASIKS